MKRVRIVGLISATTHQGSDDFNSVGGSPTPADAVLEQARDISEPGNQQLNDLDNWPVKSRQRADGIHDRPVRTELITSCRPWRSVPALNEPLPASCGSTSADCTPP